MIVVRIELWSARSGEKTELARMHITNDGTGTQALRNYNGETFIGRKTKALDQMRTSRFGKVRDWPSRRLHIWNLVCKMLNDMEYTDE